VRYATLFFDLDDTLYPPGNGLWDAIRDRMNLYMVERMKLPESEVPILRKKYYEAYGTTLRGLQKHHVIDVDDFLDYVHTLPLKEFIRPDPALRSLLLSLPQPKWIFTNADAPHADRVLAELGVADCFAGIVDIRATGFACKPQALAYEKALALAGAIDPQHCVLFDDSTRNLAPARELGLFTILVGTDRPDPSASRSVPSLLGLPGAVPELWPGSEANR
jgi:putative hydrolase of the HAD superfamily